MKRPILMKIAPLLTPLLVISGCMYTLQYSVKSDYYGGKERGNASTEGTTSPTTGEYVPPAETPTPVPAQRTFAIEHTRRKGRWGYSMETKMLDVISKSLVKLGWTPWSGETGAPSPTYTFTVTFEPPQPVSDSGVGFAFSISTHGRSALLFSPFFDLAAQNNLRILRVSAYQPKAYKPGEIPPKGSREYVWTAEIRTETTSADLIDLAKYALPQALERFPEPGYWELKERVSTRHEPSPPRR